MIDCKPLIVVVHENTETLEALQLLLSEHDCLVSTFTSAARSTEFIGRSKPDLVLAQDPGPKNGIAFLETIKKMSPFSESILLPAPLDLVGARRLRQGQADEILRIVDRILGVTVFPETRRIPHTRHFVL